MWANKLFLFVSHIAEDREAALEIVDELERRGVPRQIAPRDEHLYGQIIRAIAAARATLIIVSRRSYLDKWVRSHVSLAEDNGKLVILFCIEDVPDFFFGLRRASSTLQSVNGFSSRERGIDEVLRAITPARLEEPWSPEDETPPEELARRRAERTRAEEARQAAEFRQRMDEEKARQAEQARRSRQAEEMLRAEEARRRAEEARWLEQMGTARETRFTEEAAEVRRSEPNQVDTVEFGVAHPAAVTTRASFIVQAWLFGLGDRTNAERQALRSVGGDGNFRSEGSAGVTRGARLTVAMKVGTWRVEPRRQFVWWTGDIAHVGFRVTPDREVPSEKIDGECRISLGGLRIGFVPFQIDAAGGVPAEPWITIGSTVKSGFASYASGDRREVIPRIQGIEKCGVSVYMDVRHLASGVDYNIELLRQIDKADVLYLFWSRRAAASEWVEREWRYGLEKKGINFIDPVPLVDPRKVPPPPELGGTKHFNDWTLAYTPSASIWARLRKWVSIR